MGFKKYLLTASAAVGAAWSPGVWAQSSANSGQQAAGGSAFEEIVVTARKREERLLDVPMSITAVSAAAMEDSGIKSIDKLQDIDPAINYFADGAGQGGTPTLRGSSTRSTGQTETPIGLFQDGIYDSRPATINREPADVARVEVIKGPQGTVLGRNTIAGAISIVTNDPTDKFEGKAQAEYGGSATPGDHLWSVLGIVSGPLGGNISGRFVATHSNRGGYLYDPTSGVHGGVYDSELYRAKLLWTGSDQLRVKVSVEHSFEDRPRVDCIQFAPGKTFSSNAAIPASRLTFCGQPDVWTSIRADFQSHAKVGSNSFTGNAEYDTGIGTVTWLSGYKYGQWDNLLNTDETQYVANNGINHDRSNSLSQELRLAGQADKWTWLGGLYYFHEVSHTSLIAVNGPDASVYATGQRSTDAENKQHLSSYAAFAQISYEIVPKLKITAGLRYSSDKKQSNYDYLTVTATARTLFSVPRDGKWTSTDPSAVLTYNFRENAMIYASYGSGYRAGGFNDGTTAPSSGAAGYYNPERLHAFEAGVKGRFFDNRLQLTADGYINNYKDLLINTSNRDPVTGAIFTTQVNAATSQVTGADVSVAARVTDYLTLTGSVTNNNGQIDTFVPKVAGSATYAGLPLPKMSRWAWVIGAEYTTPLGPGEFSAHTNLRYRGRYANTVNPALDPSTGQPANLYTESFHVLDMNISYTYEMWRVNAYVRNLTNNQYIPYQVSASNATYVTSGPGERRTWGLQVSRSF